VICSNTACPRGYNILCPRTQRDKALAEVGAIALIWNQIDNFLDWLLHIALKTPLMMHCEIARRLRGSYAKVELLRISADRAKVLTDEARECIKYTLDGVVECNRYRDNIVHSMPYDIDKGIAHAFKHHSDMVQTLVTEGALRGLYQRMKLILDELREVDLVYRLADEQGAQAVYPELRDPIARRHHRDVPLQTAQTQARKKARKELPPLPQFPDDERVSLEVGGTEDRLTTTAASNPKRDASRS
jgi:hypothetical protein